MPSAVLEKQVIEKEPITIEDVKQFIIDARKKREDFLNIANRSWNEIERRNAKGRLYGGNDLYRRRQWTRFPLWWSCWKIRQPITLARLAVPVLKDTQGDDPLGRTACVIGERFIRGILKTFDAFPEFSAANDDFLVTNFGWGRACYRVDECIEDEKIRLQEVEQPAPEPVLDETGQPIPQEPPPPIFVNPAGEQVENPLFDEFGPYILSGREVTIANEEIYWEAGLYNQFLFDCDATKWSKGTRIAFEYDYSYREFKEKFGQEALGKLAQGDLQSHREGKPIKTYEYHDKFLKEVRWLAENSEDFFAPVSTSQNPDVESMQEVEPDYSDLYGLSGFFPCTEPLVINNSTKDFWPTPEYYQVCDLLDDIHSIVNRMVLLTKAIRVRFLFDSTIRELSQLIGETGEGGGLGVPNLQESLIQGRGNLANLVAYFPVDEMIQGLQNMYTAFEQRLNMFYQITGLSDLLRGQTSDVEKTYGERQLEGKFALNRIEPYQRKIQEWIKKNYELMMEMGLKMFSDKTIDEYVTPQTLDPEDKERYVPALELLKSNKRRRFRVDFETDSTIAINQEWKRKQAIELANTLTKAMESTAQVAETQPELAQTELKVLKHLIGEFADGKLFVDEIQDSIQQVIDKVAQPSDAPNIEAEKIQLEREKVAATLQLERLQIESKNALEAAKLQQAERFEAFQNRLEQIRLDNEAGMKAAELNQKATQLQADIALAQQDISVKRNQFLLELKEIATKTEVKQLELLLDSRVAQQKGQLEELYFALEKEKALLDEKEKYMTEARLQAEHQLSVITSAAELQKTMAEIKQSPPPVTVNLKLPEPKEPVKLKKRKRGKIIRDALGNAQAIELEEEDL